MIAAILTSVYPHQAIGYWIFITSLLCIFIAAGALINRFWLYRNTPATSKIKVTSPANRHAKNVIEKKVPNIP